MTGVRMYNGENKKRIIVVLKWANSTWKTFFGSRQEDFNSSDKKFLEFGLEDLNNLPVTRKTI
jgi:hypothetical protein